MQNSRSREFPKISSPRAAVLSLGIAALGLATGCAPLPEATCTACLRDCPGDLVCDDGLCIDPDAPEACDATTSSGGATTVSSTSATVTTSGSGGLTSAGAGGSGTTSTGSTADPCDPLPSTCNPELLTPRELSADCSDGFSFSLAARCACDAPDTPRNIAWELGTEIDGLTLSKDGTLSGKLPEGDYRIRVTATIDTDDQVQDDFTLAVRDRCWVVFVTDDGEDAPELVAARLNSGDLTPLPAAAEGALRDFDTSPDGRFVARVITVEEEELLDLIEFDGPHVFPHSIEAAGSHLAHAFSPDGRWLALVSTGVDDTEQVLDLIDLQEPSSIVASRTVTFEDHLTWSNTGSLLYLGRLQNDPERRVVFQRSIRDETLGSEVVVAATQSQAGEEYFGLLPTNTAYVVLTSEKLVFVGDSSDPVTHPVPETLSPDLRWLSDDAGTSVPGSVIQPVSLAKGPRPFATASDCDLVLAWSNDGSTFVCSGDTKTFVYTIRDEGGALEPVELRLPERFPGGSSRVALSATGRWLATVPDRSLVLTHRSEYATAPFDVPALGPPEGTQQWDFFFTPRETHLVVQSGRSLFVLALELASYSEPRKVAEATLPSVPSCRGGWDFDQDLWCGAPRFRGNVLLSPRERHLAFVDDSGQVHVIDLLSDRKFELGQVTTSRFERSLQFL